MSVVQCQNQEIVTASVYVHSSVSSGHVYASCNQHCSQEAERFLGKDLPRAVLYHHTRPSAPTVAKSQQPLVSSPGL